MKGTSTSHIADYIHQLRREQGLTLREISKRGGISESLLCELAHGRVINPTLDAIHRLAKGFGTSPIEVLELFGVHTPTVEQPTTTQNERRLIDAELAFHLACEQGLSGEETELIREGLHQATLAVIKERGIELPKPRASGDDDLEDILDAEYIED